MRRGIPGEILASKHLQRCTENLIVRRESKAFWFEILNQRNNIGRILITELRSQDAPKHFPRKSEYITSVSRPRYPVGFASSKLSSASESKGGIFVTWTDLNLN